MIDSFLGVLFRESDSERTPPENTLPVGSGLCKHAERDRPRALMAADQGGDRRSHVGSRFIVWERRFIPCFKCGPDQEEGVGCGVIRERRRRVMRWKKRE